MNFQMIDKRRKEKRYTVTEFCKQVGIDRTTYYKYFEAPETMRISTWYKMVTLLGMNMAERAESLK